MGTVHLHSGSQNMHPLTALEAVIRQAPPPALRISGTVVEAGAGSFAIAGVSRFVRLGDHVSLSEAGDAALAEVIRIEGERVIVKPFDAQPLVGLGARARVIGARSLLPDASWRGRVIDALGRPIDDAGVLIPGPHATSTDREPPPPMRRERVGEMVRSGVRAIDLFTPLCLGQRIGIFAGSGVGKSSLLAMIARAADFDTVIIALVGERGREVREFVEDTLGPAMASAILVVATSDESPMMRRQAPKTAMTVAEHLRDLGQNVLLIIDSVTRYAHAIREVALAAGEPPVARGYTPSVFAELPKLLERAGPGETGSGSITGIFSVLVDGEDHNDPVADAIRGTLDGHVMLDRAIADQGRYPAVDVVASISRLARSVWTEDQRLLAAKIRSLIARFEDTRDLRMLGGYKPGADPELDSAVALVPVIYQALAQDLDAPPSEDAFRELSEILREVSAAPAGRE